MSSALEQFKLKIFQLLELQKSIIWIDSFDHQYIEDVLKEYMDLIGSDIDRFKVWEGAWGGRMFLKSYDTSNGCEKLLDAIKYHTKDDDNQVLILKNIASLIKDDTEILSALYEFIFSNNKKPKTKRKTIIIISSVYVQIPELDRIIDRFSLPMPDVTDIEIELGFRKENGDSNIPVNFYDNVFVSKETKYYTYRFSKEFVEDDAIRKKLVSSLLGMHLYDIRTLLQSLQNNTKNRIGTYYSRERIKIWDYIVSEKKRIVQNSGLLEVIDLPKEQKDNIGNIDNLISFLEQPKKVMDNINVYPSKMPKPKGVLLVGSPGCGKSETAKSIASYFDKPLLRLDIGSLMGQYVGVSEHNLIEALRVAEAAQPCVLWIDEIEKAFAGFGNGDSGNDITVTRMAGYFLTWMQERKSIVYLVATANSLDSLRPELLRKGRWDEIFYLAYPNEKGAKDIFFKCINKYNLHLDEAHFGQHKINIGKDRYSIAEMIVKCEMSGADIHNMIVEIFNKCWDPNDGASNRLSVNIIEVYLKNKQELIQQRIDQDNDMVNSMLLDYRISRGGIKIENESELKKLFLQKYGHKTAQEREAYFKARGYRSAAE